MSECESEGEAAAAMASSSTLAVTLVHVEGCSEGSRSCSSWPVKRLLRPYKRLNFLSEAVEMLFLRDTEVSVSPATHVYVSGSE